jgi:hypothetical protein
MRSVFLYLAILSSPAIGADDGQVTKHDLEIMRAAVNEAISTVEAAKLDEAGKTELGKQAIVIRQISEDVHRQVAAAKLGDQANNVPLTGVADELKTALEQLRTQALVDAGEQNETALHERDSQRMDAALQAAMAKSDVAVIQAKAGLTFRAHPSAQSLSQHGPGGTLWVFWAKDAPGADYLATALLSLKQDRSDVLIQDVHMFPVSNWYAALKRVNEIKAQLELVDPSKTVAEQFPAKQKLVDDAVSDWKSIESMRTLFRAPRGYLILEDQAVPKAFGITRIPCFRFVAPSGRIHNLEGIGQHTSLTEWVDLVRKWEMDYEEKHHD